MQVRFKKLTATAKTPTRAHATDAGLDLYVDRVADDAEAVAASGGEFPYVERACRRYKSNIAVEIPEGHVGLLFPRSSVYTTCQTLSNCVGVIDSGYRGSVDAVFYVPEEAERCEAFTGLYRKGDRFAQLVIVPIPAVELVEAEELSTTDRGEGGYGSTGK